MDEELNLDAITLEDAVLMYYYGRRLVLNDGKVVGIEEKEDRP